MEKMEDEEAIGSLSVNDIDEVSMQPVTFERVDDRNRSGIRMNPAACLFSIK